jgi:hypothetical protein
VSCGQPGLALGEHDEGVEEVSTVFLAVDRWLRIAQNCLAPVRVRRQPDTFCLSLIMRMSRSEPLLSAGICRSVVKRTPERRLNNTVRGLSRLPTTVTPG